MTTVRAPALMAWAAIRHRRFQAVVLVLLSALLTAVAVFGPLYARSLENGIFIDAISRASVMQTGVVVDQLWDRDVRPDQSVAEKAIPPDLAAVLAPATVITSGKAVLTMATGRGGVLVETTIYAPEQGCAKLVITAGRCPVGKDELMISTAEAAFEGWKVGDRINVTPRGGPADPKSGPPRIVGTFDQVVDDSYWFGVRLTGRAGTRTAGEFGDRPQVDPPIVGAAFFGQRPEAVSITSSHALRRDIVGVDALPGLAASARSAQDRVPTEPADPRVSSSLGEIDDEVVRGQTQASLLVPLLVGQLALLAVVVLGLATSAAVEQRRPEIALARLRGSGVRGARRTLFAELATLVVAGVPIGFLVALPVTVASARIWLPDGVPLEVLWPAYAAAGLALGAGLGALVLASAPALREPIPSLLRRIPPRQRGWAVGLLDVVIITIALSGVVTITSGNLSGPLAMATPALLALAVGLLFALLVVPLSSALGRASLRRGHTVTGLTALQLARRPAVRRVVAIVTVASALLVFATDAYLAAARNREARAVLEAGSEFVLFTDARNPKQLRELLRTVDPTGGVMAPVAVIQRPNSGSLSTMAVVPAAMARIAGPTSRTPVPWSLIATAPVPPILLVGNRASLVVDEVSVPTIVSAQPDPMDDPAPASETPLPDSVPVKIELRDGKGSAYSVPMGRIPLHSQGAQTLQAPVYCAPSCTFTGISVDRDIGETRTIAGSFRVARLTVDGRPPVDFSSARWVSDASARPVESIVPGNPGFAVARPNSPTTFTVSFNSDTGTVTAQTSPVALPAVVVPPPTGSGAVTLSSDITSLAGYSGADVPARKVGQVPVAPGGRTNVAVVDYDAIAATATQLYANGSLEVWVADASRVPQVRSALASAGVSVTSEVSRAELLARYDASASAWALRLAIVIGVAALLLSTLVLVLVTVTSWRTRTKDYAALRLAGLRASTASRIGLGEQLVVIGLAVPLGAVCGFLGSRLALGLIPLFTDPSPTLAADLDPAYGPMVVVAVGSLLWLSVVAAVLGWWLTRRSAVSRVRDQA